MKTTSKPMVDATEAITIKIRRPDIVGAVDRNPEACVVARAVARQMGSTILGVKIGAKVAYVDRGDVIVRYLLSKETRDMIRAYDASGFYPSGVSAKLLPPPASSKLDVVRNRPTGNRGTGTGLPKVASRPWLRHVNQDTEPPAHR